MLWAQVTQYLGYSSLKDFFPTMDIKPNPGCANQLCREQQAAFQKRYNEPEAVAARQASAAEASQREQVLSAAYYLYTAGIVRSKVNSIGQ